jgi:hypothetical protein
MQEAIRTEDIQSLNQAAVRLGSGDPARSKADPLGRSLLIHPLNDDACPHFGCNPLDNLGCPGLIITATR